MIAVLLVTAVDQGCAQLNFTYHDFSEVETYLKTVNRRYPDITHLYSIGRSVRGKISIYAFPISDYRMGMIYIIQGRIQDFIEGGGHLKPIFHCDAKPFALGPGVGLNPNATIVLGIPTYWYLKTLKLALPPTQNPNASQCNIGCVGSPTQNLCSFHLRWFPNANPVCSEIWA